MVRPYNRFGFALLLAAIQSVPGMVFAQAASLTIASARRWTPTPSGLRVMIG